VTDAATVPWGATIRHAAYVPLLSLLVALTALPTAARASTEACQTVHVGPAVQAGGAASYFRITATAGSVTREALLVANPQSVPCKTILAAAYGKTATNSGNTYPTAQPAGRCVRTSCWISGLPSTVIVPGNSRILVPFEVIVPRHTAAGDYLAGVVVRPAGSGSRPRPAGATGVGAVILTSVGVGVAVRVPGTLHPSLTIPDVTLDTSEHTPRLQIIEHDGGNTWEHPAGGAIISTSGAHALRFGTSSSTILPGDSATITVPVLGTRKGLHPTEVVLHYAHFTKEAIWRGVLDYPNSSVPRRPGTPVVVVHRSTVPTWLVILAVVLGLAVLLLLLLLLALLRRRRAEEDDAAAGEGGTRVGDEGSVNSEA
jgi:hypothetical protein